MKIINTNPDNLDKKQISETVTRVKGFIINDKNQILLAWSHNAPQLPGGHAENGEGLTDTLKREVLEETGIELDDKEIVSHFLQRNYFKKDYPQLGKNRLSIIEYFYIKSNKLPNANKTNFTPEEIQNNFNVKFVGFDRFEEVIVRYLKNNPKDIYSVIAEEILLAFNCLKKYIEKQNQIEY